MSDPNVREIGRVADSIDGMELAVGVDYDTVTIGTGMGRWRLKHAEAEEFARLFVAAVWQAGAQSAAMAEDTDPEPAPTTTGEG